MFKSMVKMMKEVKTDVKSVKQNSEDAKKVASHAIKTAMEAQQAVKGLETKTKEDIAQVGAVVVATKDEVASLRADIEKFLGPRSGSGANMLGKGNTDCLVSRCSLSPDARCQYDKYTKSANHHICKYAKNGESRLDLGRLRSRLTLDNGVISYTQVS